MKISEQSEEINLYSAKRIIIPRKRITITKKGTLQ